MFLGYRFDQAMRRQALGFPTVSIVLRIVFSIVPIVLAVGGYSLAVARTSIVIGGHFPL